MEMMGGGSPERSGERTGGRFKGEKGQGALVQDDKVARAAHGEREKLVRAVVVRVAGGGEEKKSGELLRALELMAWVPFARGGKQE